MGMAAVAFDTLKFANILKKSGMPDRQAEAVAYAFSAAHEAADLATKTDLHDMETRIDAKINSVEQHLDAKINSVEQRLDAKMDSLEQRLNAKIELLGKTVVIKLGSLLVVGFGVSGAILGMVVKLSS